MTPSRFARGIKTQISRSKLAVVLTAVGFLTLLTLLSGVTIWTGTLSSSKIVSSASFPNSATAAESPKRLMIAAYDGVREPLTDLFNGFNSERKAAGKPAIGFTMSNNASGAQARAVMSGLDADIVILGLAPDIQVLVDQGKLVAANWQERLPNRASPYYSTIVFLVRKGNPKGIHDWDDLIKPGVGIITPNPKTSGAARWGYLAAYGSALRRSGSEAVALDYMRKFYGNVLIMDSGSRGSTTSFAERDQGDLLISWESEAYLAKKELGDKGFEIIYPKISIKAEPVISMVDANVTSHNSKTEVAAFLDYFYSAAGQKILMQHGLRSNLVETSRLPPITLFSLDEQFGSWQQVLLENFQDGGRFDRLFAERIVAK